MDCKTNCGFKNSLKKEEDGFYHCHCGAVIEYHDEDNWRIISRKRRTDIFPDIVNRPEEVKDHPDDTIAFFVFWTYLSLFFWIFIFILLGRL